MRHRNNNNKNYIHKKATTITTTKRAINSKHPANCLPDKPKPVKGFNAGRCIVGQ